MNQKEKKEKEPERLPEGNPSTEPRKGESHEVDTPKENNPVATSTEATATQETSEPEHIPVLGDGAVVSENDKDASENEMYASESDMDASENAAALTGEDKYRAMDLVSGKLLHQISKAIDQLDIQVIRELRKEKELVYDHPQRADKATMETVVERETLTTIHGPIDRNGIKLLAAALKDVKEIQMLRDPLDIREQEAKIAKLQREVQSESDSGAILVTFTPETEALSD